MKAKLGIKGAQSKKKLLDAAIELIADKGYRDTKISDIVKKAGLTQAAFYLYFSSKEALFAEVLQLFYAQIKTFLQSAVLKPTLSADEVPTQIRKNMEGLFTLFREQTELTKIFLTEESSHEVEKLIYQTIVSNLIKNQASGFVRSDIPSSMLANCMIGMFTHVILEELLLTQRPPKEIAHEFTDVLLFGLINQSFRDGRDNR